MAESKSNGMVMVRPVHQLFVRNRTWDHKNEREQVDALLPLDSLSSARLTESSSTRWGNGKESYTSGWTEIFPTDTTFIVGEDSTIMIQSPFAVDERRTQARQLAVTSEYQEKRGHTTTQIKDQIAELEHAIESNEVAYNQAKQSKTLEDVGALAIERDVLSQNLEEKRLELKTHVNSPELPHRVSHLRSRQTWLLKPGVGMLIHLSGKVRTFSRSSGWNNVENLPQTDTTTETTPPPVVLTWFPFDQCLVDVEKE